LIQIIITCGSLQQTISYRVSDLVKRLTVLRSSLRLTRLDTNSLGVCEYSQPATSFFISLNADSYLTYEAVIGIGILLIYSSSYSSSDCYPRLEFSNSLLFHKPLTTKFIQTQNWEFLVPLTVILGT
jgi:hypothetical protein